MLMQVRGGFADAVLQRAADADVVENGNVAHVLAQADTASVGTHRDLELLRKKQDSQQLVDLR